MNAEQINGVLHRLAVGYVSEKVLEKIEVVRSNLDAIANNSNDTNSQSSFLHSRQNLADTLSLPILSEFSIREWKLMEEMGILELTGPDLFQRVSNVLSDGQRTPRLAHEELGNIHAEINSKVGLIRKVTDGLTKLNVTLGEPPAGEAEFGLYIPRHDQNLSLSTLLDEGTDLDRLVSASYEIVEGTSNSPDVSFLTSCDYGYLVLVAPPVIEWLMKRIEHALDIAKKYAETRQALENLKSVNIPEKDIKKLLKEQKDAYDASLEKMVRKAVLEKSGADDATKNEQAAKLTAHIKIFIDRHEERGNYVDIRVNMEAMPPEGTADGPELIEIQQRISHQQQIAALNKRIQQLEQHRDRRVAQIAPPSPDKNG